MGLHRITSNVLRTERPPSVGVVTTSDGLQRGESVTSECPFGETPQLGPKAVALIALVFTVTLLLGDVLEEFRFISTKVDY